MPLEHAATFPTAYLTASHALFAVGRLQPGETVLIHAAGSGVSTAAIQLARHARGDRAGHGGHGREVRARARHRRQLHLQQPRPTT